MSECPKCGAPLTPFVSFECESLSVFDTFRQSDRCRDRVKLVASIAESEARRDALEGALRDLHDASVGSPEWIEAMHEAWKMLQGDPADYAVDRKQILHDAIRQWGAGAQITKAVEELAELIQAITKHLNSQGALGNVAEEIADVRLMLEQLELIHDLRSAVAGWERKKLKRLDHRLATLKGAEAHA